MKEEKECGLMQNISLGSKQDVLFYSAGFFFLINLRKFQSTFLKSRAEMLCLKSQIFHFSLHYFLLFFPIKNNLTNLSQVCKMVFAVLYVHVSVTKKNIRKKIDHFYMVRFSVHSWVCS